MGILFRKARRFIKTLATFARLRSWAWAAAIQDSGCAFSEVSAVKSPGGILLKRLDFELTSQNKFFLCRYKYAQGLANIGATFAIDGNSGLITATVAGTTLIINRADDIVILHEIHVMGIYRLVSNDPTLVLDIGGNMAHAALYFAAQYSAAHVVSFEPIPKTFQLAQYNLALNPSLASRIDLRNVGLSSRSENVEIEYSENMTASATLFGLREDIRNKGNLLRCTIELRDASEVVRESLEKHPSSSVLMKIDCEGSEYSILEKLADDGLLQHIDCVLMEWHSLTRVQSPSLLAEILRRNGFITFLLGDLNSITGMAYAVRRIISGKIMVPVTPDFGRQPMATKNN